MAQRADDEAIERLHEEFKRRIKTQTVLHQRRLRMLFWLCCSADQQRKVRLRATNNK